MKTGVILFERYTYVGDKGAWIVRKSHAVESIELTIDTWGLNYV